MALCIVVAVLTRTAAAQNVTSGTAEMTVGKYPVPNGFR